MVKQFKILKFINFKISDPSNPSRYEVPFKSLQYEDSCPGDAPCTNPFLNVDVGSDYLSVSNKNNESVDMAVICVAISAPLDKDDYRKWSFKIASVTDDYKFLRICCEERE